MGFESPLWLILLLLPLILLLSSFLQRFKTIITTSTLEKWKPRFSFPSLSNLSFKFSPTIKHILYSVALGSIIFNLSSPYLVKQSSRLNVILDTSLSMQRKYDDNSTNFFIAKKKISSLIDDGYTIDLYYSINGILMKKNNIKKNELDEIQPNEQQFNLAEIMGTLKQTEEYIVLTDAYHGDRTGNVKIIELEKGDPFNVSITAFDIQNNMLFLRVKSNKSAGIAIQNNSYKLQIGANNLILDKVPRNLVINVDDDLSIDNSISVESELLYVKFLGEYDELYRLIKSINWIIITESNNYDMAILNKYRGSYEELNKNTFNILTKTRRFNFGNDFIAQKAYLTTNAFISKHIDLKGPILCKNIQNMHADTLNPILNDEKGNFLSAFIDNKNLEITCGFDLDNLLKIEPNSAIMIYEMLSAAKKKQKGSSFLVNEEEATLKPAKSVSKLEIINLNSKSLLTHELLLINIILVLICLLIQFTKWF